MTTPRYALIQHQHDMDTVADARQAMEAERRAAELSRSVDAMFRQPAPAAPVINVGGCLIETDCGPDEIGTVDLPDDEPDHDGFIEGYDDFPELLNEMREDDMRGAA